MAGSLRGTQPLNLRLLTWNVFHGRDFPPDLRGGLGWKLFGRPVTGGRHVLVNRNLFFEFAALLAVAKWDLALLQEVPPRWRKPLAEATGSEPIRRLTSRNWLRPLTFPAARTRPHLPGSWEGGSNLILVRNPRLRVVERRSVRLAWRPEKRAMTMIRLADGVCVANLHASGASVRASGEVLRAAGIAVAWAGEDAPLVLGGDFNCRPRSSDVFGSLEQRFGLSGVTGPGAIDHLLTRGFGDAGTASVWRPERRDVPDPGSELLIRLSDHAPVTRTVTV